MKAIRQFALVLAIVLPLLSPTMVCALPNVHLSPAEQACCKHMDSLCGTMAMPASYGCCHKEVPTASNWNAAIRASSAKVQMDWSAIAKRSPAILLPMPVVLSDYAQWDGSTLPQSPPSAISVLRI